MRRNLKLRSSSSNSFRKIPSLLTLKNNVIRPQLRHRLYHKPSPRSSNLPRMQKPNRSLNRERSQNLIWMKTNQSFRLLKMLKKKRWHHRSLGRQLRYRHHGDSCRLRIKLILTQGKARLKLRRDLNLSKER